MSTTAVEDRHDGELPQTWYWPMSSKSETDNRVAVVAYGLTELGHREILTRSVQPFADTARDAPAALTILVHIIKERHN